MTPHTERHRVFICCGVPISACAPAEAARSIAAARFGQPRQVHLCNAYTLSVAVQDTSYRKLLTQASENYADGYPVARVGYFSGHREMTRSVRGPALMEDVLRIGQRDGLRHYFYGSTSYVCSQLGHRPANDFPPAVIAGIESPPFRPLTQPEEAAMVGRIRAARPDVVWVGLGTPQQDIFVHRYAERIGATLVAIGAGFDFLARTKPVAPAWMRRHGLEWVFRLRCEPRRLWRRYLFGNVVFITGVARERIQRA